MGAETETKAGTNAVPLIHAVFCANCETVSNSPHDACTVCGSHSLISLFRLLGGTVRSKESQSSGGHAKYSLELTAKVHEIPAPELNLLLELLTRLAEVAGTVESLHINMEATVDSHGVLRAA